MLEFVLFLFLFELKGKESYNIVYYADFGKV